MNIQIDEKTIILNNTIIVLGAFAAISFVYYMMVKSNK